MATVIEITYNFPCEVFIDRHVKALQGQNFPVQIVARHAEKKYKESASVQELTVFAHTPMIAPNFDHLSTMEKVVNLRYLIGSQEHFTFTPSLRDRVMFGYFRKLKPDLIHFHFGTLAGMMRWIPDELGIPYTLSLRGSDIQVDPLLSSVQAGQLREGLNHSAGIHTVCENLWRLAVPYLDHEIFHKTIYTTVPVIEKLPSGANDISEIRFVTVGRLHWSKNYVNLLKAFRLLIDTGLLAKLTIIGEGPDKESLLYWIAILGLQNYVDLPGKLSSESLSQILVNSNAFIQSSIAEGFSNAVAEAMAVGLPVFATNVGGTAEIIQDVWNGFLLDPIQPNLWWEKLVLVQEPNRMKEIGWNAWQTARKYFSPEKHAADFIEFYRQVLHER